MYNILRNDKLIWILSETNIKQTKMSIIKIQLFFNVDRKITGENKAQKINNFLWC